MLEKLKILALSVLTVFAPVKMAVITTLVMVFADLVLGMLAARKRNEPITSAGLGRTIVKVSVYECAILLGFLAETYLTGPVVPVCKIITGYIGLTEATSVIENLNELSGGSILKGLVAKLGSQNDTQPPQV